MTHNTIRQYKDAVPFVPFVLRMADGRAFPVRHRDYVALPPNSFNVIVFSHTDDGHSVLNGSLIAELQPEVVPELEPANGSA